MPGAPMNYECVICTRNRPDALRLSIPAILRQSRPPRRLIIVDSSDAPETIEQVVAEAGRGAPCEVMLLRSARGSSRQRNLGLALIEAEVVFFPDDDALYDPDFAARILAVYERDHDGVIGAVVGSPRTSPLRDDAPTAARQMSLTSRLRQRITPLRTRIELRLVKDPMATLAWERKAAWTLPEWLPELSAEPNCWVRGFRMTFRTDIVRDVGFDEILSDYAAFEDCHLGLAVGDTHLIVQARAARVFHHQAAGGRGSGRVRGAVNIANRAYVVARHSPVGSAHRRRVVSYGAYRCLLYGAGSLWSRHHRQSFAGALGIMVRVRPLLLAPPERAPAAYTRLITRARIGGRDPRVTAPVGV